MTAPLPVSLVIISRHRPALLRRCLTAVSQMDHPNFEAIVVTDPEGLQVATAFPVKQVAFDQPNISVARNCGIAAAAGDIVAFIDDDAVPEPRWLSLLTAPFADPEVAAAGGFVTGTNGLSLQWQAGTVDRLLHEAPLPLPAGNAPSLHHATPGRAVEIKGVNCAYRRSVLAALGGFDPALRYYLDETELNLRLAAQGALVALVPEARVLHTKAESAQRTALRLPRDLGDIGTSSAVTLRRHGATEAEIRAARARLFAHEGAKLDRLQKAGSLSGPEAARLTETLTSGFDRGMAQTLAPLPPIPPTTLLFQRFPVKKRQVVTLSGRIWQRRRLMAKADQLAAGGAIVRLFLFSPTTLFHHANYTGSGYWLQTGGLFGKSLRTDPWVRLWRFSRRLARERAHRANGFGYS